MTKYLPLAQIIISVLLVIFILLQQRGTAMGSAFGGAGGTEGGFYATKRGIQKKVYYGSIILGALFIAVAILNLLF